MLTDSVECFSVVSKQRNRKINAWSRWVLKLCGELQWIKRYIKENKTSWKIWGKKKKVWQGEYFTVNIEWNLLISLNNYGCHTQVQSGTAEFNCSVSGCNCLMMQMLKPALLELWGLGSHSSWNSSSLNLSSILHGPK